jgi:hypothetical protein
MYMYDNISLEFSLEWEIFQTEVVEIIKTHFFMFSNFFSENRAVCEIMWKNTVEPYMATDYNIMRRMRLACRVTRARI